MSIIRDVRRTEPGPGASLSCPACGVCVGVYEPTVFVGDGWTLRASVALRPDLAGAKGCQAFHEACYAAG